MNLSAQSPHPRPYFLIVAQLFPHKNIHLALEAFAKLQQWDLVVIGRGPERKPLEALKRKLGATNVHFLGFVSDAALPRWYAHARAFLYPQEEDFGITALEAMAQGTPVLALRKGGATETVLEGITGEFFDAPHPMLLANGIRRISNRITHTHYNRRIIQSHVNRFSHQQFEDRIRVFIKNIAS